uniref:Uncharacterized protein n=1 Tax=Arundo donax TaxID=35708 RepID=A0A0A9B8P2_ARUDO
MYTIIISHLCIFTKLISVFIATINNFMSSCSTGAVFPFYINCPCLYSYEIEYQPCTNQSCLTSYDGSNRGCVSYQAIS